MATRRKIVPPLASRMSFIEASGIRKMFELGASLEDRIDFSIGQPHFDAPDAVKEAAIRAIREGKNRYTVTEGIPELNARILDAIERRSGVRMEGSLVTAGVSGGLVLASLVLFEPGDEVLLPDPHFMMYRHLVRVSGATPRFYDTYPDFRIDAEKIRAQITPRTKALLLNSPQNPTGAVATEAELRAVAALAEEHGFLVLADEIYDTFVYDGPYRSIAEFTDRVLLLGGFSKTAGIPGWRIGYALGPRALIEPMRTLQQFSFVCAPAPLQHGVLASFDVDPKPWIDAYRRKRDLVVERLGSVFRLVRPGGSFYAFPALPEGVEEKAFVRAALDRKLLIVPGSAFSSRASHFRLSFAAEDDLLERGLRALREIATQGAAVRT